MTEASSEPAEPRKPSTIPSWVMLGFVLGALATCSYRNNQSAEPPRVEAVAPAEPVAAAVEVESDPATERNDYAFEDQPSFTVVEALFEQYRAWAFWEDDRTEIAVWNTRTLGFTDCFEVLRAEGRFYFRPITALTRLPLEGYGPPGCPLLFTETPAQWVARYHAARGTTPPRAPRPGMVDLPKLPPPPGPGE